MCRYVCAHGCMYTYMCMCEHVHASIYIYIDTYISLPQKEFIATEHTEVKLCTNLLTSAFLRLFFFFF